MRYSAWFGNGGDNALLSGEQLGPERATYEEAKADLASPAAAKNRGKHYAYGQSEPEEVEVIVVRES